MNLGSWRPGRGHARPPCSCCVVVWNDNGNVRWVKRNSCCYRWNALEDLRQADIQQWAAFLAVRHHRLSRRAARHVDCHLGHDPSRHRVRSRGHNQRGSHKAYDRENRKQAAKDRHNAHCATILYNEADNRLSVARLRLSLLTRQVIIQIIYAICQEIGSDAEP